MMVATAQHYQHRRSLTPHSTDRNTSSHYSSTSYYAESTAPGTSFPFSRISDGPGVGRDLKIQQSLFSILPSSTSAKAEPRSGEGATTADGRPTMQSTLHKRIFPVSSTPATASGGTLNHYNSSVSLPVGHTAATPDMHTSNSPSTTPKSKTKMKPLLRRFTPRENNSLDLSRSAAEHEGLGIYASDAAGSRSAADVTFSTIGKRGAAYHARSTSGASQYSTATTGSNPNPRPGAQYVHPKRQTPRPYTPPITQSYTNSILDSEHSGEGTGIVTDADDGEYVREHLRQARIRAERSHSLSQQQAMQQPIQPPLRIMTTTGSATRLVYGSQQNLPGTPTSFRPRADTMSPVGTVSPVSRTSMDNVFKFRSKDDSASFSDKLDVEREAFQRKQGAKARKAEKEALKAAEREMLERERREEHAVKKSVAREERVRRKSESKEKAKGRLGSTAEADVIGQEYSKLGSLPSSRGAGSKGNPRRGSTGGASQGGLRNRWTAFMVWLRFRIFKLGRKSGLEGKPY